MLVLLAMRTQKQQPEDPMKFMTDFFGNYKDPMWDKMDEWRDENEQIRTTDLPELQAQIEELENKLAGEKRKTFAVRLYK